jgi:hypothetical protein
MLNNSIPAFANEPKEYNLFPATHEKKRSRRPGSALIFSEKDLPGYKPKIFSWDEVDEDGNPGQARSYLYERHKREEKKKENKGRFVPYTRKPIPKQTSITGTVSREFEALPVKNEEFWRLENQLASEMLRVREVEGAEIKDDATEQERITSITMSTKDRQAANRVRSHRVYLMNTVLMICLGHPSPPQRHQRKPRRPYRPKRPH